MAKSHHGDLERFVATTIADTHQTPETSRSGKFRAAVTLGALEQLDLMSAVDYVTGRIDVDPAGIGALGVSLGGSTTTAGRAQRCAHEGSGGRQRI